MGEAHTHNRLVNINIGVSDIAEAELLHKVVEHALRVYFLILRSKWSDARCKSFEHQEFLETGLRIAAERRAHIERTRPIVVSEHLIHHHIVFVESALSFERNHHLVGDAVFSVGQFHSAAQNGGFVHGHHERVGGNEAKVFVAHEVVNHIREFKWVDFFAFCSELLLEFFQLVVHRHNANEIVSTHIVHVFPTIPSDGKCRTLPSWTTHLVDIPVGGEVRQVADTRIGAVAFYILVVPKREGVVVAIGEDNRISLFVERVEIVQTKVASGSAS